jgi:hypothetical protein
MEAKRCGDAHSSQAKTLITKKEFWGTGNAQQKYNRTKKITEVNSTPCEGVIREKNQQQESLLAKSWTDEK